MAYPGQRDQAGRQGVKQAATAQRYQRQLFDDVEPQGVQVDLKPVRSERGLEFGGPRLAQQLFEQLEWSALFDRLMGPGREESPWSVMAVVLVVARFCDPSSELYIAEHFYKRTALCDLPGLAGEKINDDRLYRALDHLLPHKAALEVHLKPRVGELLALKYDLLLYDVTRTYFEGLTQGHPLAPYGYRRDKRPDAKQVCIALVVSREGVPLGYEVFAGHRADVTTVEEIVETMEARYGQADRIGGWSVRRISHGWGKAGGGTSSGPREGC